MSPLEKKNEKEIDEKGGGEETALAETPEWSLILGKRS